jgi:hypothetical protein
MSAEQIRRERLKHKLAMVLEPDNEFVMSPCIAVCQMNTKTSWCEGCFRDIQEIARWGSFTDEEKKQIWLQIAQRMNPKQLRNTTAN